MATLDYVEIPQSATRLQSSTSTTTNSLRPAMKVVTSLPHPEKAPRSAAAATPTHAQSPTRSGFNFQQVLLSSTFQLPANAPAAPRATKGTPKLLSTKESLAMGTMTTNFRRFVAKVGPVFWLQDRVEEILMWRRGWKYTTVWMSAYTFLCTCHSFISLVFLTLCRLLSKVVLAAASPRSFRCLVRHSSVPTRRFRRVWEYAVDARSTTSAGPSTGLEYGLVGECPSHSEPHGRIVSGRFQRPHCNLMCV